MEDVRRRDLSPGRPLYHVVSPLVAALVWELSARAGLLDARFFPPPSEIVAEIIRLFAEENVLLDLTVSLRRIALGVAAGFVPGAVLGIVMGRASWARTTFGPLVALTYPIPKIALLPILLIIFGLGETAKIMVVAIGVFFLVVINAYAGVRRIPDVYLDVARVYRVSRAEILRRVILPACFPDLFTGLRLGVGYGLILIVAAEMVAAQRGLGWRIWMSWETYRIPELYACLGLIAFIGIVIAVILEAFEERLIHWKRR